MALRYHRPGRCWLNGSRLTQRSPDDEDADPHLTPDLPANTADLRGSCQMWPTSVMHSCPPSLNHARLKQSRKHSGLQEAKLEAYEQAQAQLQAQRAKACAPAAAMAEAPSPPAGSGLGELLGPASPPWPPAQVKASYWLQQMVKKLIGSELLQRHRSAIIRSQVNCADCRCSCQHSYLSGTGADSCSLSSRAERVQARVVMCAGMNMLQLAVASSCSLSYSAWHLSAAGRAGSAGAGHCGGRSGGLVALPRQQHGQ